MTGSGILKQVANTVTLSLSKGLRVGVGEWYRHTLVRLHERFFSSLRMTDSGIY
jgi:hypothetical protein